MSLWPQSLSTRVFLLYGLTVGLASLCGLSLMIHQEFGRQIEGSRQAVEKMANMADHNLAESALIGDFDTIKRTLERIVPNSPLKSAVYVGSEGGLIVVDEASPDDAPGWLNAMIAQRLPPMRWSIAMGGREYGQLHLSFDSMHVASDLWGLIKNAALLTLIGLSLGLLLMRVLLRRWLRNLRRLQMYEVQVLSGAVDANATLLPDAPLEIQQAITILNRTAGSLRAQFGQRIDVLMQSLIQHKRAMDEAALVCELDTQGRLVYINDHFVASMRVDRALLHGQLLGDICATEWISHGPWVPGADVWSGEVRLRRSDGGLRFHRRSIVPQLDLMGRVEKYVCIDIDITAQKRSQFTLVGQVRRQRFLTDFGRQALEGSDLQALMERAVETAQAGLMARHGALLLQPPDQDHPRLAAGLGWQPQWLGLSMPQVLEGLEAERPALRLPQALLNAHGICSVLAIEGESASGHRFLLAVAEAHERRFADTDRDFLRNITHVLSAAIDRYLSRENLTRLARFDHLTGLPNRSVFQERLKAALQPSTSDSPLLCLMYMDLDRFKQVNDTLGHEAGDQLLVQAGERMVACLRTGDVVSRLSGDEFAVLLVGMSHAVVAERVARKLLKELSRPFVVQGQEVFISASIGLTLSSSWDADADNLLRQADQAMYHAKRSGRNRIHFYRQEMSSRVSERLAFEGLLRGALSRKEFFLLYQPKVSLTSGHVTGLEALLRWRHPDLGVVAPSEFIHLLEENGLVMEVGLWVLRSVAEQIVCWQHEGLDVPRVALNLSARQFASGELAQELRDLIHERQVPPGLLEFEITESTLMDNPEQSAQVIEGFRAAGVVISVDDFGTGYSSLSYLHRFSLDAVKVDRTFIHDLASNAENASITWAIINLAHMLKLKVVAEGVETEEQLDLLTAHGCDEIQGFYFSPPLAAQDCMNLLRARKSLQRRSNSDEFTEGCWRHFDQAHA